MSNEQWAQELGCKRRHAIKLLNGLIAKNLLQKTGRGTQTNLWALVFTEHQQDPASAYRTLPSAQRTLALVHTEHQTSVLRTPKKIKEDHLEDQREDQAVADAPTPTPSSPAKKQKTSAPRKTAFPSKAYWEAEKPNLLKWVKEKGFKGSDDQAMAWINERLEQLETSAAQRGYRFVCWKATFQSWFGHQIPDALYALFLRLVKASKGSKDEFHQRWQESPRLAAFKFDAGQVEDYRQELQNFNEDSKEGTKMLKTFRKTIKL